MKLTKKQEGTLSIVVAIFVLFVAIMNPMTALIIAVAALLLLGLLRLIH